MARLHGAHRKEMRPEGRKGQDTKTGGAIQQRLVPTMRQAKEGPGGERQRARESGSERVTAGAGTSSGAGARGADRKTSGAAFSAERGAVNALQQRVQSDFSAWPDFSEQQEWAGGVHVAAMIAQWLPARTHATASSARTGRFHGCDLLAIDKPSHAFEKTQEDRGSVAGTGLLS
jgi:hypothetical protein